MFNGIVKKRGIISKINLQKRGLDLFIKSNFLFVSKDIGTSLSCNGVCLTLVEFKKKISRFYISNETLNRSTFKNLNIGDSVNLEKPMKFGQDVSGHFMQGHVDCIASVKNIKNSYKSRIINFNLQRKFINLLSEKASIAINGVSLTINKVKKKSFEICIIPHTLKLTNLINLNKNDLVNIEIDILSKYVKKYIK